MATGALGVSQTEAYPTYDTPATPAAPEPTNRNQSALEVTDAEKGMNSLDSAVRNMERERDEKRRKDGTSEGNERVYDSLW